MQVDNNRLISNNITYDISIFSTAYLPPISYFQAMMRSGKVQLEAYEHYQKQSYRNRCRIATANGVETLSIPIESAGGKKMTIRDVRISEHDGWRKNHWRAISSAYRNSPFFEFLQDDFAPFYEKKQTFLWDYNFDLINLIIKVLNINKSIELTNTYNTERPDAYHWCDVIHPKKASIGCIKPYYQIFSDRHGFQSDLSIVDLLFNMGNEAIFTLNAH